MRYFIDLKKLLSQISPLLLMNNLPSLFLPAIVGLLTGIGHGIVSEHLELPFSLTEQIFPSSSVFLEMVRRDYPQVYRAKEVTFGALSVVDGDLTQTVWLTGLDGSRVLALYTMVRVPTGDWLINGCALLRQDNRSI